MTRKKIVDMPSPDELDRCEAILKLDAGTALDPTALARLVAHGHADPPGEGGTAKLTPAGRDFARETLRRLRAITPARRPVRRSA